MIKNTYKVLHTFFGFDLMRMLEQHVVFEFSVSIVFEVMFFIVIEKLI
jgi:hypothetical protein